MRSKFLEFYDVLLLLLLLFIFGLDIKTAYFEYVDPSFNSDYGGEIEFI